MKTTFPTPLVFALLGLAWFARLAAEERFSFAATPGKLPKDVIPRHYELELKPDLESATFTGRETVEIDVLQTTRRVVLNAAELIITSARRAKGGPFQVTLDETNQLAVLDAALPLAPGRHRLELEFSGRIGESAAGMFIIKYTAPGGPKKMVATQFEATDARRVFPCFDEPAFRATFGLTAVVPSGLKAVSNMPVLDTKPGADGWKKVRFARTPSMPTYLLVLVAGELEEIHGRAGKVDTHVWFSEGKQDQARYALENSKRLLAYYEKYFGVAFPLPKLDHIAMPGGFGGAMEHWGAITYNEGRILFDPKSSSQDLREESFGIMAHEMAHQWFGNLVTMAWWDNLWLNEGFASWMGTKSTDALNPEWAAWVRTDAGRDGLMSRDARKSTHPIQRAVASESQIGDAFDDITYQKGMCFIRMLEDYLGEKPFRSGLQRYFRRHKYSNTTTADLWNAMAEASGKPVGEFAAGWTEQPGLPVVVASSRCVNGGQELELKQERFTLMDPRPAPLRWKIPVSSARLGAKSGAAQVLIGNDPVTIKAGRCEEAVILNAGNRGYYRVAYDRPMFERIRANWKSLSVADRVGFLGDAWAMAETGRIPADGYLDLLPHLADETSLAVWGQSLATLGLVDGLLAGQAIQSDFRKRVIALLHPAVARLGLQAQPGESAGRGQWRARVLAMLGAMGEPEVVAEAKRRFAEFCRDPKTLTGDLRGAFLNVVGEHAAPAEYEALTRLAKAAVQEEDRGLYLAALARAMEPEFARRTLALSLSKDFPPAPSAQLVAGVSATGRHAQAAWDFSREHFKELLALVDGPFENMYAGSTVAGFSDDAHAAEYVEFIRANRHPDALAKAEEAADNIRYKAFLKRQILPAVESWSRKL